MLFISDNSLTVHMFTGAGAGARKKFRGAGAASKQDGSEKSKKITKLVMGAHFFILPLPPSPFIIFICEI